MKQAVTLLKQVKLDGIWKRYSVVFTRNGSIKAGVVLVGDKEHKVEGGTFILDWYENSKRVRLSVGKDAADALAAKERKEAELKHVANGGSGLVNGTTAKTEKTPLKDAIAAFLEKKKLEQRKKTYQAYRTALTYFQNSCHKIFIQDVDDMDLSRFKKLLEDGGLEYTDYEGKTKVMKAQSERSVYNKREVVTFLLKEYKVTRADGKPILRGTDRIKPRSDKHKAYEREEVEALLGACNADEAVWFKFFLLTGVREQEAAHLTWDNVDLRHRVVSIRDNPTFGFKLKTQAARRDISMGDSLHDLLKDWKDRRDVGCGLVFPTAGCRPKLDFLDCLKRVAKRANVKRITLHRWRATYATWSHRSGTDARTIQKMMGHEKLETTMLYLASVEGAEAVSKANAFANYAGL
jgi:integrase